MRKTTVRENLTTAFGCLAGVRDDGVVVRDIRVRIAKSPKGNRKVVDATVEAVAFGDAPRTMRLTGIDSADLRSDALHRLLPVVQQAAIDVRLGEQREDGDGINDHRAGEDTGPVCGADTSTGDACKRPSADGTACWQHGGDSNRRGLVAKADGTPVVTQAAQRTTTHQPKASGPVDWAEVARVAAEAAARAAVEAAMAAHA